MNFTGPTAKLTPESGDERLPLHISPEAVNTELGELMAALTAVEMTDGQQAA